MNLEKKLKEQQQSKSDCMKERGKLTKKRF
jgi:hypothetical protein